MPPRHHINHPDASARHSQPTPSPIPQYQPQSRPATFHSVRAPLPLHLHPNHSSWAPSTHPFQSRPPPATRIRVGCLVPSSLSNQCIFTPPQSQDELHRTDDIYLPRPISAHSRQSTMSAATASTVDLLPRMGQSSGMHSPFSIPHSLFNSDAGPSSFPSSRPPAPSSIDTSARKNADLLDALAGPSGALKLSSPSSAAAPPSSLELSQNAGSSLSAGGAFGASGAYSSNGGASGGLGSTNIRSGGGGGAGGRDDLHRNGAPGDGSGSGGNGGDDSHDDKDDKEKAKKSNPLVDLLDTEAAYVSELSKIIKKVAAAWSRSNFPPPELDAMFRNTEAIYRANRSFLKALKEIGPNPSSPKALGDLLMKWIDDLEAPYSRFCESYLCDFDAWSAVQSNPRLANLLLDVSGATDADGNPVTFSDRKRDPNEPWTLDGLFALPHIRLKYYKKLYSRLLKSTQPGRSDHRLLVGANEKLDELVDKSKRRLAVSVLDEVAGRESRDSSFAESNVNSESSQRERVSSATSQSDSQSPNSRPVQTLGNKTSPTRGPSTGTANAASTASSAATSSLLPAAGRAPTPGGMPLFGAPTSQLNGLSLDHPSISAPRPELVRGNSEVASVHESGSQTAGEDSASTRTNSLSQPIENLEKRLDTSKTLDIFTMKPKKCQLQMHPPNLPFARALRKSADVVIHFTPSSGGPEISIRRAHMFLLTDLFLVCERMTPSEKAELSKGGVGPDMWLLYPPLAGKHLRVADLGGQGNTLSITILKKETLTVHTDSREAKDEWLEHFADCQKFAANLGLKVKTGSSTLSAPSAASSVSAASLGSAQPSLTTPALSPAISVTPSSTHGHDDVAESMPSTFGNDGPNSSPVIGSDLSRQASFNSVASFPKAAALGSPDLGNFAPGSSSAFSPRSPSPSNFGPGGAPPNGPHGFGGARPPMQMRPGMMSPSNGALSPDTSPAAGPVRYGPGGFGPNGPMAMGRPPLMQDPNMPPRSPGGMRGPPGPPGGPPGAGGAMFPRGGPSPPYRRPSAPNLRQASHGSSGGGRTSDEGEGGRSFIRTRSVSSTGSTAPKLPSAMMKEGRDRSERGTDVSPPSSPVAKKQGPFRSTVSAQMRCKLFLKQGHAQWKSLGNARLKLFHILPDDIKQLVVENERKTLISTIVLTDGVERVGKVGVAVELSDRGNRTGIIYMLQMRSEESASGLFGQLLEGSDRTAAATSMAGSFA
ncbi:hypothetical protein PANT_2d00059 [Moesziomyces antarcticus T-34]|uniref:DH domain-containing protein n=1 Tax=Pseudozyma antarctica (strain T-34) TaxID=1151754 RepID=M9MC10_PSEA3|nr:hypothetical protein PANT_2d00059 [Moesziomyces antarcticus T-34]